MELLRRNRIATLIVLVVAIILTISVVFFFQNISEPSPTPHSSSTPISSPSPTKNTPTPTIKASSTPTSIPTATSLPTPTPSPFPGEVSQYQGQNLTPISAYIDYLIAHPDVGIAGTQYIDKATYQLAITGLVNNPINYSYDEIVDNFNSTLEVATLPCVEGWSVTLLWQGVPLSDLLRVQMLVQMQQHSFFWQPTVTQRHYHWTM